MTVIVTGANSGIGEATARALARKGAAVTLACRSLERAEAAAERIRATVPTAELRTERLDLASFASVRAAAAELLESHPRLDVLVNNAGLYLHDRTVTEDGLESMGQINHFGPFLLTQLLLPRLLEAPSARIVSVSSRAHRMARLRFEDLQAEARFHAFERYGTTKLMNLLHVRALSRRLDPARVTVNALHPGVVATGFAQDDAGLFGKLVKWAAPFLRDAEGGARASIYLASSPEVEGVTGKYFVDEHEARPRAAALDDDDAQRLWKESLALTGAPDLAPA